MGTALRFPAAVFGNVFQIDRLLSRSEPGEVEAADRRYRADAVITLFSLPIYSRTNVGSGSLTLRRERNAASRRVSLEFAAGSFPGRARGLNRLGFIREVVIERDGAPPEAAYFGFMTSSPEENLDQAKAALPAGQEAQIPYTAIDGYAGGRSSHARIAHFHFPARYSWSNCPRLVHEARASFEATGPEAREIALPTERCSAHTFLHAVLCAVSHPDIRFETPYVYNGRQFRLKTEKSRDERMGREFQSRHLCSSSAGITRFRGQVTEVANRRQTSFKIWMDENSGPRLPVRIEFQPRSFLRLAFEFDPTPQPVFARKEDS